MSNLRKNIFRYINGWKTKGYPEDIPDKIPTVLAELNLAPSYKAIALCILKNDNNLKILGYTEKKSEWYTILKRIELKDKGKIKKKRYRQLALF